MSARLGLTVALIFGAYSAPAEEQGIQRILDFAWGNRDETLLKGEDWIWSPSPHGLSRFDFTLPRSGIAEAQAYSDASSLYYLSEVREKPLATEMTAGPLLSVEFGSDAYSADITLPIQKNLAVLIGTASTQQSLQYGLSYRETLGQRSLINGSVGKADQDYWASLSLTNLVFTEKIEDLISVSLSNGALNASYGQRHFNVLHGLNVAWAIGTAENGLTLHTSLEKEYEVGKGAITAKMGSGISPSISVRFEYSPSKIGGFASLGNENTSLLAPSLSKLRRNALPDLWKEQVLPELGLN